MMIELTPALRATQFRATWEGVRRISRATFPTSLAISRFFSLILQRLDSFLRVFFAFTFPGFPVYFPERTPPPIAPHAVTAMSSASAIGVRSRSTVR